MLWRVKLSTQRGISEWALGESLLECNYSNRATAELPSPKQIRGCGLLPLVMKALAAHILDPYCSFIPFCIKHILDLGCSFVPPNCGTIWSAFRLLIIHLLLEKWCWCPASLQQCHLTWHSSWGFTFGIDYVAGHGIPSHDVLILLDGILYCSNWRNINM